MPLLIRTARRRIDQSRRPVRSDRQTRADRPPTSDGNTAPSPNTNAGLAASSAFVVMQQGAVSSDAAGLRIFRATLCKDELQTARCAGWTSIVKGNTARSVREFVRQRCITSRARWQKLYPCSVKFRFTRDAQPNRGWRPNGNKAQVNTSAASSTSHNRNNKDETISRPLR